MSSPEFKVTEIFYSIQGEGYFTGKPAIFIRFTGCNLNCDFCDEPEHKFPGKIYTEHQILEEIKQYDPCQFVILTGGEPTIQTNFDLLVESLRSLGYFVAVETNGTTKIKCHPDWITVSPKTDSFIYGDELKIVYQNQNLKDFEKLPFKYFYIQPLNFQNEINYNSMEKCIKIIEQNPKWRLSMQIHKVMKIR